MESMGTLIVHGSPGTEGGMQRVGGKVQAEGSRLYAKARVPSISCSPSFTLCFSSSHL